MWKKRLYNIQLSIRYKGIYEGALQTRGIWWLNYHYTAYLCSQTEEWTLQLSSHRTDPWQQDTQTGFWYLQRVFPATVWPIHKQADRIRHTASDAHLPLPVQIRVSGNSLVSLIFTLFFNASQKIHRKRDKLYYSTHFSCFK